MKLKVKLEGTKNKNTPAAMAITMQEKFDAK